MGVSRRETPRLSCTCWVLSESYSVMVLVFRSQEQGFPLADTGLYREKGSYGLESFNLSFRGSNCP